MFRFSSYLLPVPENSNNLRVIKLDEKHLQTPDGIKEFRHLLRKLKKSKAAEIVWLSDDVPQMDYIQFDEADKKQSKIKNKKITANSKAEELLWKPAQGERNKLAWMLEKYDVFLTQTNKLPRQQNNIDYENFLIFNTGWRKYIPDFFISPVKTYQTNQVQSSYRIYPFDFEGGSSASLIWYTDDAGEIKTLPDLSLAVFNQYQKNKKLSWNESGVINMGSSVIKAGFKGHVYYYFSNLTNKHSLIDFINIESAKQKSGGFYKNKIILIGQNKQQLQMLSDSIKSINAAAIYYTPVNSWWIMPVLMLLIVAYLLWLLPMLSKFSGVFLGAFIILSIISAQPVLLILKGVWWPTINLLLLLLIGQLAVYIYVSGKELIDDILNKQFDAWFQLGHYQYEKGDYEMAITSLLKCNASEDVLSDLYEIGLSFERKRQYDRALQIYSEINVRQNNFKDIEKRINSMSGFSDSHTQIFSPAQAQKTLVMPEMEMPEFGRYKIEREIGRGAMGVVYLGKDPKINRSVAIKTLDYTQLSKSELKTIKSRFFREAEAAGRLSHNNIVTVYDVGEETDFAFIAMDYVEGVPLSDYCQKSKLLDVQEVYQILQVVAQTLDYAHAQNIVHRDIKPSNIMYNPQNKQIKITDFGIARITDSVKTRTGSFMGSPSYMAPEQMTGSSVDGQADLYSLGVSMYQLLTGQLPFDADNLGNLAYKITNEKHKPIRDVRADLPASATRIINKSLQKKKEKRYTSGAEMAAALKKGMP